MWISTQRSLQFRNRYNLRILWLILWHYCSLFQVMCIMNTALQRKLLTYSNYQIYTDFDFLKFKRKLKSITCFLVDLLLQETNQVLETPLFQILGGWIYCHTCILYVYRMKLRQNLPSRERETTPLVCGYVLRFVRVLFAYTCFVLTVTLINYQFWLTLYMLCISVK